MSTRDSEMTGNTSALALFRNRPFALLWLSQMISNLGDMALYIVLPVTVYKATGSKSELAITFVCGTLPALLFSLLGGVLADRWPQRRTMIAADLARMAALLLLLLVHNVKHFGPHDLLLFYTVSFLVASFSCFFSPARQSLMRIAVPKEQLLQANSLVFTGSQGCSLLGPAVGGLLLAFLSAKSVFVFDAATFAVSALLIALVQVPLSALQDRPTKPRRGPAGVWEDAREGISYITKSQILRPALTLILFAAASSQITNTLEFPFVRDVWHGSAGQYAALVSIGYAAAVLTGAAGAGPLRSVAPARLLLIGFLIMGVTGLFFAWTTGLVRVLHRQLDPQHRQHHFVPKKRPAAHSRPGQRDHQPVHEDGADGRRPADGGPQQHRSRPARPAPDLHGSRGHVLLLRPAGLGDAGASFGAGCQRCLAAAG